MKKVTTTVKAAMIGVLGFSVLSMSACSNDNKAEDPKEVAEEVNDDRFEEKDTRKDADFIVDAATINMEEIALGKLAMTKGTLPAVKDLGKMMVTEHEKALKDIKALAAKKNIELPAALPEEVQEDHDKLMEKSGNDFDKAYSEKMVKGHKDAISKFEKAADNAEDGDIRNWASSMIPSLQMHLDHAQKTEDAAKAAKK